MKDGVTFYFMRHAQTYLNYFNRMQGWANAPLTPKGIQDAHRSGRGLADVRFDAVYTSDLARTLETAKIILSENHHAEQLDIIQMPEFREVHYGYFEGLEANKIWTEMTEAVREECGLSGQDEVPVEDILDMMKRRDPEGLAESYFEFWQRVELGLLELLHKHAGTDQHVLIVCHGLAIRNLLHGLVADFDYGNEHLRNVSISTVRYEEGQFRLLNYNQTSHFTD